MGTCGKVCILYKTQVTWLYEMAQAVMDEQTHGNTGLSVDQVVTK